MLIRVLICPRKGINVMSLSQLARSIRESATLKLNETAALLRDKGEPIIHLGGGEPKSKAPMDAVINCTALLNTGEIRYTAPDGIPALVKNRSFLRFGTFNLPVTFACYIVLRCVLKSCCRSGKVSRLVHRVCLSSRRVCARKEAIEASRGDSEESRLDTAAAVPQRKNRRSAGRHSAQSRSTPLGHRLGFWFGPGF